MRKAATFVCLLLCVAPAQAAVDPATFNSLSFQQHPGAQLPLDAELIDSSGRAETLGTALSRRPSALVLEYLHCKNLCSLVLSGATAAMRQAQLEPGRELNLIAISIDPRDKPVDSAAAEKLYSQRFSDPAAATAGLRFFTASPHQVKRIASAVGFPFRYDRASDQFAHAAGFVVTTPDGRISQYMLGANPRPAVLKRAVAEAALEKVEPPAHPLLCVCFGYDPDEGSVAALTLRLVRWTSLAVVIACATLIAFLSLRRRAA